MCCLAKQGIALTARWNAAHFILPAWQLEGDASRVVVDLFGAGDGQGLAEEHRLGEGERRGGRAAGRVE